MKTKPKSPTTIKHEVAMEASARRISDGLERIGDLLLLIHIRLLKIPTATDSERRTP